MVSYFCCLISYVVCSAVSDLDKLRITVAVFRGLKIKCAVAIIYGIYNVRR